MSFAINGTALTITSPGGTDTLDYCLNGETISATDGSGFDFLYVR